MFLTSRDVGPCCLLWVSKYVYSEYSVSVDEQQSPPYELLLTRSRLSGGANRTAPLSGVRAAGDIRCLGDVL